jgi:hypothetical protein
MGSLWLSLEPGKPVNMTTNFKLQTTDYLTVQLIPPSFSSFNTTPASAN